MADEVYARIGAAIRSERDDAGMTQASLADRAGLKRTSVTNIENGGQAITLRQLLDVARALGIDASKLIQAAERLGAGSIATPPNHPHASELLRQMSSVRSGAR